LPPARQMGLLSPIKYFYFFALPSQMALFRKNAASPRLCRLTTFEAQQSNQQPDGA